jgi:hypothetical protein
MVFDFYSDSHKIICCCKYEAYEGDEQGNIAYPCYVVFLIVLEVLSNSKNKVFSSFFILVNTKIR